jgi:hypothetical protein
VGGRRRSGSSAPLPLRIWEGDREWGTEKRRLSQWAPRTRIVTIRGTPPAPSISIRRSPRARLVLSRFIPAPMTGGTHVHAIQPVVRCGLLAFLPVAIVLAAPRVGSRPANSGHHSAPRAAAAPLAQQLLPASTSMKICRRRHSLQNARSPLHMFMHAHPSQIKTHPAGTIVQRYATAYAVVAAGASSASNEDLDAFFSASLQTNVWGFSFF